MFTSIFFCTCTFTQIETILHTICTIITLDGKPLLNTSHTQWKNFPKNLLENKVGKKYTNRGLYWRAYSNKNGLSDAKFLEFGGWLGIIFYSSIQQPQQLWSGNLRKKFLSFIPLASKKWSNQKNKIKSTLIYLKFFWDFLTVRKFLKCNYVKFIYSEKATKYCEIFTLLLIGTT